MYCVLDTTVTVPGHPDVEVGPLVPVGPARLKATTLGQWMKTANPASRVFAVSGKDRAAINMAGAGADGTFWWDEDRGFNTYAPKGTDIAPRLAPVASFDAELHARWAKAPPVWRPLDRRCTLGGSDRFGDLTIAHRLPPFTPAKLWGDPAALNDLHATPMLDEVTLELATRLLASQQLGRRDAPDLLAISLSATDYVGHRFGPGGPEMCDHLAHLDRALGQFLDRLQALKLPVVVVLTADHGGLDAVERVAARGVPADRLKPIAVAELAKAVQDELGLTTLPLTGDPQQIVITATDPAVRTRVEAATIVRLEKLPGVFRVFTRAEVVAAVPRPGTPPDELSLAERFHESFDPERSGDIMVAYASYSSGGVLPVPPTPTSLYVATHGSPWNYDRRVPILFWWPGATGFEQPLPVETVDIAPTLAALLSIGTPPVDGRCLDLDAATAGSTCTAPK